MEHDTQTGTGADGFVDPELQRILNEQLRAEYEDIDDGLIEPASPYVETPPVSVAGRHRHYHEARERRLKFLERIKSGGSIDESCDAAGITKATYSSWRQRYREFAAEVDSARVYAEESTDIHWDGTPASFHAKFFGRKLTWFQLHCINLLDQIPLGHILLVLWPPDHGKTSTFEDHCNRKLALEPSFRTLVAGEGRSQAQKVLGAVMNRMDPMGPTPGYVARFGPFMPQSTRSTQPWSDIRFRVWKARHADQREYSMEAFGITSKTMLSARTDLAHGDDIQSTESLGSTARRVEKLRQDFWSRAGAHGRKSLFGSRVGDGDVWDELFADDGFMASAAVHMIKLRAIITDPNTHEVRALWPERYNLDQLEEQRVTGGSEPFDRNFMMAPGASTKGHRTFTREAVDLCKDGEISLTHRPTPGSICYIGLDPSIGGRNCVLAAEATGDNQLIVRVIREHTELFNNSQIMGEVRHAIEFCELDGGHVTDLVIEDKAFQKGLLQDEALITLRGEKHFSVSGHQTGWNKYDDDIGVPSMAESLIRREIVIPWADDDYTRAMSSELCRQLYSWKPGLRGTQLRQDMVMALWFVWILWRNRWKQPGQARKKHDRMRRPGLPWSPTKSGLLVPQGGGLR